MPTFQWEGLQLYGAELYMMTDDNRELALGGEWGGLLNVGDSGMSGERQSGSARYTKCHRGAVSEEPPGYKIYVYT